MTVASFAEFAAAGGGTVDSDSQNVESSIYTRSTREKNKILDKKIFGVYSTLEHSEFSQTEPYVWLAITNNDETAILDRFIPTRRRFFIGIRIQGANNQPDYNRFAGGGGFICSAIEGLLRPGLRPAEMVFKAQMESQKEDVSYFIGFTCYNRTARYEYDRTKDELTKENISYEDWIEKHQFANVMLTLNSKKQLTVWFNTKEGFQKLTDQPLYYKYRPL